MLGTNYDDESTREALQTLSELYANASSTNSKGKEISKDVNGNNDFLLGDDDDDEQLGTEEEKASILVENTPGEAAVRARKNLKRDMEIRLAEGSRHFLKVLSQVDEVCVRLTKKSKLCNETSPQKLVAVQKQVSAMHISLEESEKHLQLTNEASKSLLDRAGNLREERCAIF